MSLERTHSEPRTVRARTRTLNVHVSIKRDGFSEYDAHQRFGSVSNAIDASVYRLSRRLLPLMRCYLRLYPCRSQLLLQLRYNQSMDNETSVQVLVSQFPGVVDALHAQEVVSICASLALFIFLIYTTPVPPVAAFTLGRSHVFSYV